MRMKSGSKMTFDQFQAKVQRFALAVTINVYMFAFKLDVVHLTIYVFVLDKWKNYFKKK